MVLRGGGGGVDGAAVVAGERPGGVGVGGVEVVDVVLPVLLALDHFPRGVPYVVERRAKLWYLGCVNPAMKLEFTQPCTFCFQISTSTETILTLKNRELIHFWLFG